ncbi:MAG: M13 family metallopeptidase [Micrococcaceae bacterium]
MPSPQPSPREDLYRHINGEWLDTNEIPADQGAYGAFMELRDAAEEAVHSLATDAAAALSDGTVEGQPAEDAGEAAFTANNDDDGATARIGALYTAFMDTERIERRGLEPIIAELSQIEGVSSVEELLELSAVLQRSGVSGLIATGALNDAGNPERMLLHLLQDGLGLPDESYYRDESFAQILADYRQHVANLFGLAGIGGDPQQTQRDADDVVDLETRIAAVHWDVVTCRDAVKRYNLLGRDELVELFPLVTSWLAGIVGEAENRSAEVVVWQPDFLSGIQRLLTEAPLATWKRWLQLQLLRSAAPYLTEAFVNENFEFYGRKIAGTEEVRPRWKRAVSFINGAVGEDVGRLYVARHFPEEHKSAMDELVSTLLEAYRRSISSLEWMSEDTRQRALEKLSLFNPMVGYPVKWIDYSSLVVDPRDLMASVFAASEFAFERDLAKIETGPDPEEWHMSPQTVNAYYSPLENAIVFPAAILQPPFFDPEASAAQNFGGIGAVIGHEIGHGFDDQGSQYAGDGTLRDWWTADDREAFSARTAQLVEQYAALTPDVAPEHPVNGELTLGENIGDLGGLGIAHQALAIHQEEHQQSDADADREFFTSWATVWRQLTRRETMITRIASDPHSPNEFRCNQVVKNLDAFHAAFGTEPGDPMWLEPEQRVTIW